MAQRALHRWHQEKTWHYGATGYNEKDLAWPCRSLFFVIDRILHCCHAFVMIILICNDHLDLQVYSSATLLELDDIYTRRLAGFTNLPGLRLSWLLSSLPALLSSLLISKLSCLSMLILWLPCCHNFQYQIHDGYNPTWKYFRLLQCHELQTPSAEHQGTHTICTSRNATNCLVQ